MFVISIKRYLKTPVLILLTVLWSAFFIYGLLTNPYGDFIYDGPRNVLEKVQVSFLFLIFTSPKAGRRGLMKPLRGYLTECLSRYPVSWYFWHFSHWQFPLEHSHFYTGK